MVENLFDANTRELGNRSLMLIRSWKARSERPTEVDGRRTYHRHWRSPWDARHPLRNAFAFIVRLPATLVRFRRLLINEAVSRINVHYPDLDSLLWIALRRWLPARPPLILSFHGADLTMAAAATGMARFLWTRLLLRTDEIVLCSEPLRIEFEKAFGKLPHLRVIDNGVDPDSLLSKAAAAPAFELSPKSIVCLATFEDKKGIDVLLKAFDLLADRDADIHLVIAGRVAGTDVFERIEAQRRSLRHAARVRLLQDVAHTEAMRLLQRARLCVLPSRKEPFGIAVLEAGALARPVVATSACGVARRLQDGTELLVVAPDDATALAGAMERVMSDDALAARLGTSLRQRVHSDFTWARIVHQYAALGAAQ